MADIKADVLLDTKGLNCPLPVLKTKKTIDNMHSGEILEVISTDHGSKADIPALLKRLGHELIDTKDEGGMIYFFIRKK